MRHLEALDAVAIVATADAMPVIGDAVAQLHRPPAVLLVRQDGVSEITRAGQREGAPLDAVDESPPLLQLQTSGSTARPKQVVRTHGQVLRELWALQRSFGVNNTDRFLGVVPFFHVNGLVRTLLTALISGASVYAFEGLPRRSILESIERSRLTIIGATPPVFALLGQSPLPTPIKLSSVRLAFSASAPLRQGDQERFLRAYGVHVRQLYGSTETGTISLNDEPAPLRKPWSVGRPLTSVTVDIVGPLGEALGSGQEGELMIRSPFAATGYIDDPRATTQSFRGGFYATGDLGLRDNEGDIRLTGRTTFLINRGGLKVNPSEVEEILLMHPAVSDAMVYGQTGPDGDELVCAAVVASDALNTADIVGHSRRHLAEFKVPSVVTFVEALSRTPTGKLRRPRIVRL